MKLVSARRYKADLSDIIGILYEHQMSGKPIDFTKIENAVIELYGSWEMADSYAREILEKALNYPDLKTLFESQMEEEKHAKSIILDVDQKYPHLLNENNINDIIEAARNKKNRTPE